MFISLIGMSGSGKSRWSKKLRDEFGFKLFCCDELIEQKLRQEIKGYTHHGIAQVAEWMGTPLDERYNERKATYLSFERQTLTAALEAVEAVKKHGTYAGLQDIVIDTTGSVIYLEDDLLDRLRNETTIVYLETPAPSHQELCRRYLSKPKPIIWDNSFSVLPNETREQTLARCLDTLMHNRSELYKKLAHVELDFESHNTNFISARDFVELINASASSKK